MKLLIALAALLLVSVVQAQSNSALRDPAQVRAFKKTHACPVSGKIQASCPGYVVDHIMPLCAGGADSPSNMQWQLADDGKKKDRVEMLLCRCMGTVK